MNQIVADGAELLRRFQPDVFGIESNQFQDLLAGTGIGRAAYSVMEQGKIDMLISAKPEDRRAVFEEAAGITKFKGQKKEAFALGPSLDPIPPSPEMTLTAPEIGGRGGGGGVCAAVATGGA